MSSRFREPLIKLAARGMRWSGGMPLIRAFSRRFEIARTPRGKVAGVRRVREGKFAIICYHRVGEGGVPFYANFDPRKFEKQLRFLRKAYRIVSMGQLCAELDHGARPGQAVAITFDDGYRDLYANALPVLKKYGIPATVYVTGSSIETGEVSWYDRIFALVMRCEKSTFHFEGLQRLDFVLTSTTSRLQAATTIVKVLRGYSNRERVSACAALEKQTNVPESELRGRMLSWAQIREMQESGIFIGAHTMNHPVVSRLSAAEREHELLDSKRLLEERLQNPVDHFAYPFGSVSDIDSETCSLMPQYGYKSAVSSVWGLNTSATPRYLLRRMGGEESSLSLFAARLQNLFLNDEPGPAEMQMLDKVAQSEVSTQAFRGRRDLGAEA